MKHIVKYFSAVAAVILLVLPGHAAELSPAAFADVGKTLQLRLDAIRDALGFPGATAAVLLEDGRMVKLATGIVRTGGTTAARNMDFDPLKNPWPGTVRRPWAG